MNRPVPNAARSAGRLLTWRRPLSTTPRQARRKSGDRFANWRERTRTGERERIREAASSQALLTFDTLNDSKDGSPPDEPPGLSAAVAEMQKTRAQSVLQKLAMKYLESVRDHIISLHAKGDDAGRDDVVRHARAYREILVDAFRNAASGAKSLESNPLYARLRDAFNSGDAAQGGLLRRHIHYGFIEHIASTRFTPEMKTSMKKLLDFRFPYEWYPATRALQRTIHIHVGPTNSGKTYTALKALENAKSGLYAGPLRLLATEVYQRLTAKGHACSLITGEEVRVPEGTDQYFWSCTVEMTPFNRRVDVAVIDEIQMITDRERGNAWSAALMGVQADEVHVCGEERAVSLIQSLCAAIGDKCIIHRYKRLSPLGTMDKSINYDYGNLKKGDAIVAFSRLALHQLKRVIEEMTGRRCAIIYGSLPPEVRVQQAALFNDPDNDYDFVVASDAIGMGLNLEVRRVIFDTVMKFDGRSKRRLHFPEIKQIGGRAGRFRTAISDAAATESGVAPPPTKGLVTTFEETDLRLIQQAFASPSKDITNASIFPAAGVVERFASFFPLGTPLSYILLRIKAMATVGPRWTLDIPRCMLETADILQDMPLSIYDRLTFCFLPVVFKIPESIECLKALARVVAENTAGHLVDIKEIPLEHLDLKFEDFQGAESFNNQSAYLAKLESLHVAINQYLWLSYRYSGVFRSQALAMHVRGLVEQRLVQALENMNFAKGKLEARRRAWRATAKSYDRSDGEEAEDWAGDDAVRAAPRLVSGV